MKIAVVDDNEADVELFLKLIEEYAQRHHKTIYTVVFSKGEELLKKFKKEKFSAIFLDIYMEGISGVEAARKIRKKDTDVRLIFTTTSEEYFAEGFEVEATHYLLKPLNTKKIEEVMQRLHVFFDEEETMLTLQNGSRQVKIPKNKILYIETIRNGIMICCKDNQIPIHCSISVATEMLQCSNFLRCHRYSIVCLDAVEKVENDSFIMTDGRRILLRREGRKELKETYYRYFMNKMRENV